MTDDIITTLAADIRREHEPASQAYASAVEHAVRCGELLAQAKDRVTQRRMAAVARQALPATMSIRTTWQHGLDLQWVRGETKVAPRDSQDRPKCGLQTVVPLECAKALHGRRNVQSLEVAV